MNTATSKIFFPGLNGLRFIAAFVVIIHNTEQVRYQFGFYNHWENSFFNTIGGLGVTLFFVLSGFLITYLLLAEKGKYKNISVKRFYIRRMLRIWPLYFLMVILALYILPHFHMLDIPGWSPYEPQGLLYKTLLYFVLFPNVVNLFFVTIPYLGQAWSIGVEEQFYLVWPWIIKFTTNYLRALLIIVFGMLFLPTALWLISFIPKFYFNHHIYTALAFIRLYLDQFRIGCMAIGGMGAYVLFFKKKKVLEFLFRKSTQLVVFILTIVLCGTGFIFPIANHELYSVLFCIIILNVSSNPKPLINLENKPLDFLGRISYGLYMYHQLCIVLAVHLLVHYLHFNFETLPQEILLSALSIIITVIMAALSYYLYEKRFLNLKGRFMRVKSMAGRFGEEHQKKREVSSER